MGHVMGWHDAATNCSAYTVMGFPFSPAGVSNMQLPSSPLCTDISATLAQYSAGDGAANYSQTSSSSEDCYDVYYAQDYWTWTYDGGTTFTFTYQYTNYYFLYTDCSGPPEF
jgi:hypothetical protein